VVTIYDNVILFSMTPCFALLYYHS